MSIPSTLDAMGLARLLSPIIYKSDKTILRDFSRRPKSLPPFEVCGGKKIFETEKVIDFYPPGIGAAIRRALENKWDGSEAKKEKISSVSRPPLIRSIAEDLMAATGGA